MGGVKYTVERKGLIGSLCIGIFLLSMLFFVKIHPIVMVDTDDWYFAYVPRTALPLWKAWNPIRVFAEVFMPIVSMFGAFVIRIFVKDYFYSLTYSYAMAVSVVITILMVSLFNCFKKQNVSDRTNIILLFIFAICHFWIFRSSIEGNQYMLLSTNATTYFFYVIPNLLNCIAVLQMHKWREAEDFYMEFCKEKYLSIILLYFCICSNIWASIILASYTGAMLLIDIIIDKKRDGIVFWVKKHRIQISIMFFWCISQIFELNGGRARAIKSQSYLEELVNVLKAAKEILMNMNRNFAISVLLIVVTGIALTVFKKQWNLLISMMRIIISFVAMAAYLILSCAMTGSAYLRMPMVFYGCFFFGMILVMICTYQVMRYSSFIHCMMPLLLLIILVDCNTKGKTFQESNARSLPPSICMDINHDIMRQFLEAQNRGEKEIILYVPDFGSSDNYPVATYATDTISGHFYKMGLTEYKINVTEIIPSVEKSKKLNIDKF